VERPRTQYAYSGDVSIAYCRADSGPIDVVLTPGFASHLELQWEPPFSGLSFDRLARFSRLTQIEKRGVGLSDRISEPATLEQRMDDVRAVMDAEGIDRAALIGISEGALMSALFAATYPDRVSSLVLGGGGAGPPAGEEVRSWLLPWTEKKWGSGEVMSMFVRVGSEPDVERLAKLERYSMSPRMARALMSMNLDIDMRDVSWWRAIMDASDTMLFFMPNDVLRLVGPAPMAEGQFIEIILDEAPLRKAMNVLGLGKRDPGSSEKQVGASPLIWLRHPMSHLPRPLPSHAAAVDPLPEPIPVRRPV